MTVLSAANDAAILLRGEGFTALFGNTVDQMAAELATIAQEAALDIVDRHDWQALTKLATLTGNAVATAFDLPADYRRQLKKGDLHSTNWQTLRFRPVRDLDEWLDFQTTLVPGTPGRWIVLGGQMQILPAMATGEQARFYYISKNYAAPDKAAFTADTDTFKLDERLLRLALIWRWRAHKRLEYAEDMANFEAALATAIGSDRSPRPLVMGGVRMPAGVEHAWPGTIVP